MNSSGPASQTPAAAGGDHPSQNPVATGPLCLYLPFPPSVNGLYAGKARRYKSKAYKTWITEAGYMLLKQPLKHFSVPVVETISLGRPKLNRTRDVWNYEKAINDLLVVHGVLMDDSLIEDGRIRWDAEVVGARVEIEPA